MASPTCRPHLAAKLPGVTYNREDTVTQPPAAPDLELFDAAPSLAAAASSISSRGVRGVQYL